MAVTPTGGNIEEAHARCSFRDPLGQDRSGDLHTGLSFITWALVCGCGKNVNRLRDELGAWYPLRPKLVTFGLGT